MGYLDGLALVDQHCHGVSRSRLDADAFARLVTESHDPPPPGASCFDTQLGFAIRRWCAPQLGLPAHAEPAEYLRRREELGPDEVNRRLLRAARIRHFLVDTGFGGGPEMLSPPELAEVTDAEAYEVVRLESVAEEVFRAGTTAQGFAADLGTALDKAAFSAVAVKSVLAYRFGLAVEPAAPSRAEVVRAAGAWLETGEPRLTDPVLLRYLLWSGIDLGLPVQLHTGFGDPDLDLQRSDPLLLTDFLRAAGGRGGVDIVLLHGYPFHRHAGYLANVFPHVYVDVGLTVNHVGARAAAVVGEVLELTPFHKLMFSTDAYGLAELYLVGAMLFGRALDRVLGEWVGAGDWSGADAERVAKMISVDNAFRVYSLHRAAAQL